MATDTSFALARRLRAGETVYSAWCALGSPIVVESIVREGFTAAVLDAQHGLWDTAAIVAAIVSRALDFGAESIIAPMINTATDARAFAAVAKYPPLGERSWGPTRAMALQGKSAALDYLREANEGTLTCAMIETPTALANVNEIATTPGIDALFIGPYDLSTSLSAGKAQDILAPEVERAIDVICEAAVKAGKIPGIYCRDASRALAMARRGFRYITVGSDLGFLRDGTAAQLKTLKG